MSGVGSGYMALLLEVSVLGKLLKSPSLALDR